MDSKFEASIIDGVPKHFVFGALDQWQRPIALTLPLTFTGQDGQIVVDGNGLGFTATLAPGASSEFSVSQADAVTAVRIDSPLPVVTTITVSQDPDPAPAA